MKPSIRSYAVAIAGIIVVMLLALRSELNSAEASHSNAGAPPPGTKITYANWEQYKEFMPPAMQALFAGEYFWKMPADVQMEVGPTLPIPLPPAYLADTEKNAGQVTLQKLPGAGYIPAGYTTGLPFPTRLANRRWRHMQSSTICTITTIRAFNNPFSVTIREIPTATLLPPAR